MQLHEQYRPTDLDDVIGQDKAVKTLKTIGRRGWAGKALWITGKSGTGKTTLARIVAHLAASDYAMAEIDGQDCSIGFVRDWESRIKVRPIGCEAHVLIVNEAHTLRNDVVSRLLTVLESTGFTRNAVLILTTTHEGDSLFSENFDAGPFASRTIPIALASRGINKTFAERAKQIAAAEGLDGQPIEKYERLANDCRGNLRMMLARIESGEMAG
jgi:replication-associated recombination protein RarA